MHAVAADHGGFRSCSAWPSPSAAVQGATMLTLVAVDVYRKRGRPPRPLPAGAAALDHAPAARR